MPGLEWLKLSFDCFLWFTAACFCRRWLIYTEYCLWCHEHSTGSRITNNEYIIHNVFIIDKREMINIIAWTKVEYYFTSHGVHSFEICLVFIFSQYYKTCLNLIKKIIQTTYSQTQKKHQAYHRLVSFFYNHTDMITYKLKWDYIYLWDSNQPNIQI